MESNHLRDSLEDPSQQKKVFRRRHLQATHSDAQLLNPQDDKPVPFESFDAGGKSPQIQKLQMIIHKQKEPVHSQQHFLQMRSNKFARKKVETDPTTES